MEDGGKQKGKDESVGISFTTFTTILSTIVLLPLPLVREK